MATKKEIFNNALMAIGQDPLSRETDQHRNGKYCRNFYPMAAKTVLQTFEWNCAMSRAKLTAIEETDPVWNADLTGFEYQYLLPVDCLTLVSVNGSKEESRLVERRYLYFNSDEVQILYVADISEPATEGGDIPYSPLLADSISLLMAYRLATSIATDKKGQQSVQIYQEYLRTLQEAQGHDAMERSEDNEGEWVRE